LERPSRNPAKKKATDKQTDFMVNPGHKKHKNGNSQKSKSVDQKTKHPLRVGWRNFFSAVLEKFLQPINAPQVYGT
jgi:hypothetical protein